MLSQPCSLVSSCKLLASDLPERLEKVPEKSADGHLNTESHDGFAIIMGIWEYIGFKARLIFSIPLLRCPRDSCDYRGREV
jgi:hypothetical protein